MFVLDTSAFIAGLDPLSLRNEVFSVPLVKEELSVNSMPWVRFKTAVESGKLKIRAPQKEFIEKVREFSKVAGDVLYLSEADVQVLALALELKELVGSPVLVTDDYSIQNVAKSLDIEFAPLLTFGIKFFFQWALYCPACRKKYPQDYKFKKCEICGTELKRKPVKKRFIK